MPVTVAAVQTARPPGAERRTITTVTLDNSYAEGGEPLTAAQLGLTKVTFAECSVVNGSELEANPVDTAYYTPATSKIHVIDGKTSKEMAGTKDMSKVVIQVTAYGF